MSRGRIRRAQLISPFGVGAMSVLVDGTSVITAGLDHWYASDQRANLQAEEFVVDEWRLQRRLRVAQLRLPPDFRTPARGGGYQPNLNLTVPVLRFPCWSFCPYCKRLQRHPLTLAERARCPDRKHAERSVKPVMAQVPFVVICRAGHVADFPWREWGHRSARPTCQGTLRLESRGGGTLAGQVVSCDECNSRRPLENVTIATSRGGEERTHLTDNLEKGSTFSCAGSRPWLADPGAGCGLPLRAALRGASNIYFAVVESAIYLPSANSQVSPELLELLRSPGLHSRLSLVMQLFGQLDAASVRTADQTGILDPFTDAELLAGVQEVFGPGADTGDIDASGSEEDLPGREEWRYPEWQLLREGTDHPDLTISDPGLHQALSGVLGRVRLAEQLRETRVLRGFTRVQDSPLRLSLGKALLRRTPLAPSRDWLPAYVVRGEGVYLELAPQRLATWEAGGDVLRRAERMAARFAGVQRERGLRPRQVTPRFVLLHTFAHVLINQLVFECGYSSASLRERLYTSDSKAGPMAGCLIYTAAGDSEGTMGGLVRMGRPANLARVAAEALDRARWCSTDPVCMEAGEGGQGPDSCNMAACHGCALIPETACEEFNRFLDRGLVIGTLDQPGLGYFS
jgi:MrfA Zn-binding domain